MTNLGHKVLFLDLDQKVEKMVNLKKLLESGQIQVQTISAKLAETDLRKRILTPKAAIVKQPKGYLEFCDMISALEKMSDDLCFSGTPHECSVLVIDSLTALLEHLDRLISHLQKREHWTFDEWAILLTNLEDFFYTMMRLQNLFKHVIIIAHEQTEKDETSGRVLDILPQIKGSMRYKAAKYFEEVYVTSCEVKSTGPAQYFVTTKPVGKLHARTSREIETTVKADFAEIFKEEAI